MKLERIRHGLTVCVISVLAAVSAGCTSQDEVNLKAASEIIESEQSTWDEMKIFDAFNECHKLYIVDGVFRNWSQDSIDCLTKEARFAAVTERVAAKLSNIGATSEPDLLAETVSALEGVKRSPICDQFDWNPGTSTGCGVQLRNRVSAYDEVNRVLAEWYSIQTN